MYRLLYTLFFTLFIIVSLPAFADEHILTPLVGYSKWSDPTGHTARGSAISFEDKKQTSSGFRYLYLLDNNFAVGADIYGHDMDVTPSAQADKATIVHVHALIDYFFSRIERTSFFIGAGYGFSVIGFTGGILNDKVTAGNSLELNGGVLYRFSEHIGMQLEYKYTYFDMKEDIDSQPSNIESSSNSLLLGLTIHI